MQWFQLFQFYLSCLPNIRTTSHATQVKCLVSPLHEKAWFKAFYFYWITSILARMIQQLLCYFFPTLYFKIWLIWDQKDWKKSQKIFEFGHIFSLCKLEHVWIWQFNNFIILSCRKLGNSKANFLIVILLEIFAWDILPSAVKSMLRKVQ